MNSCRELLERMLGFDTINGSLSKKPHPERDLALYLEELAASWGLQTRRCPVQNDHFNLLITCQGAADADWLLFDSHLDTVSVNGMSIAPFTAVYRDGKIFGRGACDTKGSGAAMLWALRQYAQQPRRDFNVGLLFSIDEEAGMTGAAAFTLGELGKWSAHSRIRGIIVGEPTQMRPVIAHGGLVRGKIVTRGRAAHSSDPAKGKSAISLMVKVVAAFESSYIPTITARHPLAGKAVASINVIHGGSQVNIIPDYCEVELDRRLMPGETVAGVLLELERLIESLRPAKSGDDEITFKPVFTLEALNPEGADGFVQFVGEVLKKKGLDDTSIGAPWATNASHYSTRIPAIVMGPGDIAQAHTSDEWIAVSQLDLAARIYLDLMRSPAAD